MKHVTFENIDNPATIFAENELYRHYHYPEMLKRYDSNFIDFKKMPTVDSFKETANFLRVFHVERGQKHVKFAFPENEKLSDELTIYLTNEDYDIGFYELYAIQPENFPQVSNHPDIEIKVVTEGSFDVFLKLQYEQDLLFGEEFATQKIGLHKRNFANPNIVQLLAFYQGTPAGTVQVIISDEFAEIDDLVVDDEFQRKGIGSRLQKLVMDMFKDKTIILVADGEDTPREMYQKQNYQYIGYKYNVQKVYE
ncbi:GNAT family N-acetyltransferase [Bacillus suaedaesalsae]|uniref:GNAT family N-acetyltransferase n=1 Tax=Bacillus suaedaesalsae TaxID=2810349 RepID=A0ABS2DDQ7_9BACI|nr:GNAT family N-acetyltransferase [Bacillus suaedaesalsae]MBM6616589.1 GNAT family N-acetyltransferase [Bacillus suaedaesalsae]